MEHYLFQEFLNVCKIFGSGDYAGYDRFVSVSCETFGLKFIVKIFICLVTSPWSSYVWPQTVFSCGRLLRRVVVSIFKEWKKEAVQHW